MNRLLDARMFIGVQMGPSFWVDTAANKDHSPVGAKPVRIEYLLVKRAGVVHFRVWKQRRSVDVLNPTALFASIGNDGVVIARVRDDSKPARLDGLDGKGIFGLRFHRMRNRTGAVVSGRVLEDVTFDSYQDNPRPQLSLQVEVVRWTYNPASMTDYVLPEDDAFLQEDARRVLEDEGAG